MFKKKIMLLSILLISLLAVSTVSAAENITDGIASTEDTAVSLKTTDTVVNLGDIENQYNDDILKTDQNTFADLNTTINDNNDGDVYLNEDYVFSIDNDTDFKGGVVISRDVTIHGNGHSIDANDNAMIFQITTDNSVTFMDIAFLNAKSSGKGSAIYLSNCSCTIDYCSFINCSSQNYGAVVAGTSSVCHIEDSNFIGNSAKWGGAIYAFDGNCSAVNCNFTSNQATTYGGAIYYVSAVNCTFTDNSAVKEGGAAYSGYSKSQSYVNCTFVGNSAKDGGALVFGNAVNCTFIANSASNNGGALMYSEVANSTFRENYASMRGGAIYQGSALNCAFDNNSAVYGGATYQGYAYNSNFTNNLAYNGGAVSESSASNCTFIYNNATGYGGAMYKGSAVNSTFINNTAGKEGNNIYQTTAENCTFALIQPSITVPPLDDVSRGINITVTLPNDATGSITLTVNSKDYAFDVIGGKANVTIPELDSGNYPYAITYSGDEDYSVCVVSGNMTINNPYVILTPQATAFTYGDEVVINVEYGTTSGVTAAIDGKSVEVIDSRISISGLDAGPHTLTVTTVGDENHIAVKDSMNITVNKANQTLILPGSVTLDYGSSVTLNILYDSTCNLTADVDGKSVEVIDNKILITDLNAGAHTLAVQAAGDANHNPTSKSANITINKVSSTLELDDIQFDYGKTGFANAAYTGATGILANVENHTEAIVNITGKVISVSGLDAGSYILNVATVADENHNPIEKTANITVNKIATDIIASKVTTVYGTAKNLVITLQDSEGNPLSGKQIVVKLNGKDYKATTKNGKATIVVPATLSAKSYSASITFAGDANHIKKTKSVSVSVSKSATKLIASNKAFYVKSTKKVTAILKDSKNRVIKNKIVSFTVNGKTYKVKTNSKGVATAAVKIAKKGTFKTLVKFAGDANYKPISKYIKIVVK